jgi:hypothetical protein
MTDSEQNSRASPKLLRAPRPKINWQVLATEIDCGNIACSQAGVSRRNSDLEIENRTA